MIPLYAKDIFYRMGISHSTQYDHLSLNKTLQAIKQNRQEAATELHIQTTHWLVKTLEALKAAPVHAVFPTGVLVFAENVDSRLKLRPLEVELWVGMLEAAGAQCPVTCRCQTRTCFSSLRKLFARLGKSCALPEHNVICKCKAKHK